MRNLLLIPLLIGTFTANGLFAQNKDYETDFKTLRYCIDSLSFPEIDYKNEKANAKKNFERDIKNWYNSHPGFESVLKISDYDQYKEIFKIESIKNYPPKPQFVDTGNPQQDEISYKNIIKKWTENHPDYPKYIDTGNFTEDKKRLRLARLAFYDKYIKNK